MGKENLSANNHHCRQREKLKKLWAEYRNPIFIPVIASTATTVIFRLLVNWISQRQ